MKKLSLKLTGIKEVLKKDEMKQIRGGGSLVNCYDECNASTGCGHGSCVPASSCYHSGGPAYLVCL
jgi:natural product precursor